MKRLSLAALLVLASSTLTRAQPPQDRPPPQERPPIGQPEDPAQYRARLERSAAESKRRWERFEAAIKKLDQGAPIDEVRRETEGLRPPGNREPGNGRRPGPRGEDPYRPDQPPSGERLSRDEVLAVIESSNAAFGAKIKQALADNPAVAGRLVDRMEPMVREIKAERDPEMRELRVKNLTNGFELLGATRAFLDAHRADANAPATKDAAQNLRTLLGAHFDLRTQMHKQEIVMLERRITQLREELERQLKDRDSFIERRIEDLKKGFKGRGDRDPRRDGEPKSDPKTPSPRG